MPLSPEDAPTGAAEVMVAMRDGIRLHTKIWQPAGEGPHPVVFTTPPTVDFKGEAAIALAVDDIKTAVAELREKEVSFAVDIKDSGVCYFAVLTDPDGNRVWLHQGYADYHNE